MFSRFQLFMFLANCDNLGVSAVQPVSLLGAHGHAASRPQRLRHQGAEPRPGGPGWRQADHRRRGQAGGGKELSEELHRSEPGGLAAHGLAAAGAAPSSLANAATPPAGPVGVQPHVQPAETLACCGSFLILFSATTPMLSL